MEAITVHEGVCAPIQVDNVDTDQIIPSREMNRVSKQGLGEGLFAGWRYVYEDMKKTGLRDDFVLNQLLEGAELEVLSDQSIFIRNSIQEVQNSALLGGSVS